MMKLLHFSSLLTLVSKTLLLGVLGICLDAHAQIGHSSHPEKSAPLKTTSACQGTGLECANAATPFFANDGQLLLAWTANGVVSVAKSTDLGKTFAPATTIAEHGKALDTGSDARPQIVSDSKGNVFLAYAFFKDSQWNAQINTARSNDSGITFSTPQSLVQDGSSQRFPSVILKADDSIFISWIDKRLVAAAKQKGTPRLGGSIAYSTSDDGGKSFQTEKFANESSCECCRIGASLDPKNQAVIAYRAIFSGGIRDQATQLITAKGAEPIRRVADDDWKTDACPHHGPSIAVSGSGTYHVAWFTQGTKRAGVFYANSSNQGMSYSNPVRVGTERSNVARPYLLAIDRQVWLVWKEFDGSTSSVYLKHSQDDGSTWSEPKVLVKTTAYSDHPLLVRQDQNIYLSWLTRADGYQLIKVGHKR